MICCGKTGLGHISRFFTMNSGAIHLEKPKNLTGPDFSSGNQSNPTGPWSVIDNQLPQVHWSVGK
jgi:hypothetical protein